jgi:hypothetical protein
MGRALYNPPTPHEHDYPSKESTWDGTIWECNCGRAFMLGWKYFEGSGVYREWWELKGRRLKKVLKRHNLALK